MFQGPSDVAIPRSVEVRGTDPLRTQCCINDQLPTDLHHPELHFEEATKLWRACEKDYFPGRLESWVLREAPVVETLKVCLRLLLSNAPHRNLWSGRRTRKLRHKNSHLSRQEGPICDGSRRQNGSAFSVWIHYTLLLRTFLVVDIRKSLSGPSSSNVSSSS